MKFNLLAVLPAVLATSHVAKSLAKPYEHFYEERTPHSQSVGDEQNSHSFSSLNENNISYLTDSSGAGDSSGSG
ncbi:hypothetical protein CWB96_14000, partial [Pseudoalteromonas citrea]